MIISADRSITAGFIVPDLASSTISSNPASTLSAPTSMSAMAQTATTTAIPSNVASTHSASTSNSALAQTTISSTTTTTTTTASDKPPNNQSDLVTQETRDEIKSSSLLPSESMLETVADLPVFDSDGKTVPFKSLYWVDGRDSKRVMIIFIRHFFCGNCQEYLRTLASKIPPSSLPSDTLIRIVGCGSHTLIQSYVEQTNCPYPIFADPSKKLYSILGMARTWSLGNKGPDYIQHTIVSGMVKSIAQGLKRIGSGDVLQAGDMKQVGGEFLFEVTGGGTRLTASNDGNKALKKLKVTWCHRMQNTRDHAELPELKSVLGLDTADEEERRRKAEPGWRHSGLARTLSNKKTQGLNWSISTRRSRGAAGNASHHRNQIDPVGEEGKNQEDGLIGDGQKPAATQGTK